MPALAELKTEFTSKIIAIKTLSHFIDGPPTHYLQTLRLSTY